MPSTVASVFAAAGIGRVGVERWGTPLPPTASGVYVVALTPELDIGAAAALASAPLSAHALEHLLMVCDDVRVDGEPATVELLAERLRDFWLAEEPVLYIGLASSLRSRVGAYYRTRLGARRPHAGGWWLKTLASLDELWVHYAPTPTFEDDEKLMLRAFADAVSPAARRALFDSERVMPFANLRGWADLVKRHRITGATGGLP
jgi:hypothetical protein